MMFECVCVVVFTCCFCPLPLRYELTHAKYITKLPAGKHSTKGVCVCVGVWVGGWVHVCIYVQAYVCVHVLACDWVSVHVYMCV